MKKFRFTLDKLLDYKGQLLEKEKNDLAALNLRRAETQEEIELLESELHRAQDSFNEKAARGIAATDMMVFANYQKGLRIKIEDARKELCEIEKEVERQTGVVVEASKEVSSLEKLEEKQLEEYKFRAAKAEESFIEEYVNGNAVRSAMAQN